MARVWTGTNITGQTIGGDGHAYPTSMRLLGFAMKRTLSKRTNFPPGKNVGRLRARLAFSDR